MMAPAWTGWPAKPLPPSRLAAESRPLRDEPRPFLCAIARTSLGGRARSRARGLADPLDADAAQLRTVAAHALLAALGLVGEDAQLLAADVLDHLGADRVGQLGA